MKNIKYKLLHRDAFLIIASVLFSLGMILAVYLVNNIPDAYATGPRPHGWRVGATTQVINLDNECRNVVKTGGLDFFVPTATVAEWTSFRTRPPANAMVSVCTFCQANPDGTVVSAGTWSGWGTCIGCAFASTCATSATGTQLRTRTNFVCSGGVPVPSTESQRQSCICSRHTTGMSCGPTTLGPCSFCTWASPCATSGSGIRIVTNWTCSAGSCVSSSTSQACTCARTTDGTVCGSGLVCQAGNCVPTPAPPAPAPPAPAPTFCQANPNGTACGTPSAWSVCGSCSYTTTCATTGTGTQSRTVPVCVGGNCTGSATETQSCTCTRTTAGTVVSTGTWSTWGTCGACSYTTTCATTGTGTQSRTRTNSVCSGGVPVNSTETENQACTCTRSTAGNSCGTVGAWNTCHTCTYSSTCDESGSGVQGRVIHICSGGSCVHSSETRTCTCTRNTLGVNCGGIWVCCDGLCRCQNF